MSNKTVTAVGTWMPEGESSKPLRRPDYVLRMAIDANIAVTMERVSAVCWATGLLVASFAPGLWTAIACAVLGLASFTLMALSERRMRRVNEATGVTKC